VRLGEGLGVVVLVVADLLGLGVGFGSSPLPEQAASNPAISTIASNRPATSKSWHRAAIKTTRATSLWTTVGPPPERLPRRSVGVSRPETPHFRREGEQTRA
jgi:hypothetical protein